MRFPGTGKRLGIFAMHDKDGIADAYVLYLLKETIKSLSHLVVVCNGDMKEDAVAKLKIYADDVFIREDSGFDIAAYKIAITQYLGWEKVYQYDEVIFFNDSFYGPLYPFSKMFQIMDIKDLDFWGITASAETVNFWEVGEFTYLPPHIQSYFLAVRSSLLKSPDYRRFWEEIDDIQTFVDAVTKYEIRFTDTFAKLGYKWEPYVDTSRFMSERKENNINPYAFYSFPMIKYLHCPIIKRKNFVHPLNDTLGINNGEDIVKSLNYIDDCTEYNTNLIWDNLLRVYSIEDIYSALHLNYPLPLSARIRNDAINEKCCVIMHLNYIDLIAVCVEHMRSIPAYMDIIITTKSEEKKRLIEQKLCEANIKNWRILIAEDRGRELSALLVACHPYLLQYTYLCFVHDKQTSRGIGSPAVGMCFMDNIWHNLLGSPQYIENIIDTFLKNSRLGFLSPPTPKHASYIGSLGNEWGQDYEITKKLAGQLGLHCDLSENRQPFALSTSFWCRTAALKNLFEREYCYEGFPPEPLAIDGTLNHAYERIFPYVAQDEGFYSGIVMTDKYAALETVNLQHMLSALLNKVRLNTAVLNLPQTLKSFDSETLKLFCKDIKHLYIYGAGDYANRTYRAMCKLGIAVDAFIVTDHLKNPDSLCGKKVIKFSEFSVPHDSYGVVLALNKRNQLDVAPALQAEGIKNLFFI